MPTFLGSIFTLRYILKRQLVVLPRLEAELPNPDGLGTSYHRVTISHCTPEALLSIPGFGETRWFFDLQQGAGIFKLTWATDNATPLFDFVDMTPSSYDSDNSWWITPKGFPLPEPSPQPVKVASPPPPPKPREPAAKTISSSIIKLYRPGEIHPFLKEFHEFKNDFRESNPGLHELYVKSAMEILTEAYACVRRMNRFSNIDASSLSYVLSEGIAKLINEESSYAEADVRLRRLGLFPWCEIVDTSGD